MFTQDQLWANNNTPKTNSLFAEVCKPTDTPILSLNNEKYGLPILGKLYVAHTIEDPTEVHFAELIFNDLRYWLRLREASFIQKYLEEWREMADIKRKSVAFEGIMQEIKTNGRSAFTAAKYLIEEPWKPKTKESTLKKNNTARAAFQANKDSWQEDLKRLEQEGLLQ